jgi:hypothetical protein
MLPWLAWPLNKKGIRPAALCIYVHAFSSYKASKGLIANLRNEFRLLGSVSYHDILAACHAAG